MMLVELRSKAEAATPGPWNHYGWLVCTEAMDIAAWPYAELPPAEWNGSEDQWNRDAEFIAAVSPDRVLALLDLLDDAEHALRGWHQWLRFNSMAYPVSCPEDATDAWLAAFRVAKGEQ